MSSQTLEQINTPDNIGELTRKHSIDTPEVLELLRALKNNAEPYAKRMLDNAINGAIKNTDSSKVAEAFRKFAQEVQEGRTLVLNRELIKLVADLGLEKAPV
jgi:3-methyladenine DNA glycosylase AlkC